MKSFEDFLKEGSVKRVTPNILLVKSLFSDALERLRFYKSINLDRDASKFIFENIYDSLRELTDAILAKDGYKSYSHEASIIYLSTYSINQMDISKFDRFRKIRNNSKYYGKPVDLEDTKEILELLERLLNKIKSILNL